MIGGDEIEVDLIDKGDLGAHFSIGGLDLRSGVWKKFSGDGAGGGNGNHTGLLGYGCFDRLDMLFDLVVAFEINNEHLVFPESEIAMVQVGQLAVNDDGSGNQDDRNGELEDDQRLS